MPERFELSKTDDKPEILLDQEENIFEMSGKSLPENSAEFYSPVKDWFLEYLKQPNEETHLVCKFDYFNSSSARRILEILILLKSISLTENKVKVSWYCEKDDLLLQNKGKEMLSILEIPFEILEY